MCYSFLYESVARRLVSASNFSSRRSVVQQILQKFPTPHKLADELEYCSKFVRGQEQQDFLDTALTCRGVDPVEYPAFVKKIVGVSKIWKMLAVAAGTTAAVVGAKYLVNDYINNTDKSKNWEDRAQQTTANTLKDLHGVGQKVASQQVINPAYKVVRNTVPVTWLRNKLSDPAQSAEQMRTGLYNVSNGIKNAVNNSLKSITKEQ